MRKRRILIADNDRFTVEAVGDLLREAGFGVRKAYDGLEALQAIRREPPDVLILDLIMPKVDGARLCRYLREDPRLKHIPVIVFSGLAARDMGEMAGLEVLKTTLPDSSSGLSRNSRILWVSREM